MSESLLNNGNCSKGEPAAQGEVVSFLWMEIFKQRLRDQLIQVAGQDISFLGYQIVNSVLYDSVFSPFLRPVP